MRRIFCFSIVAILLAASCEANNELTKLQAQAAAEYLEPIRQGGIDGQPFWNEFSGKFTYAPAFDIPEVEGAASYRFDFWKVSDIFRNERLKPLEERPAADLMKEQYEKSATYISSFTADSPKAALSPVWNSLPVCYIGLVVTAVDKEGKDIANAGTREFLRDFPFNVNYEQAPRSYTEAAFKALKFMDRHKVTAGCRANTIDERIRLVESANLYANKLVSACIKAQVLLARLDPDRSGIYIQTARNAADWLIEQSEPADAPLANFPPTYYNSEKKHEMTMSMEPLYALEAYLDFYDYTGEEKYFNAAIAIARTYNRLVSPTGFIPKKLVVATGEPVGTDGALTGGLLSDMQTLHNKYGVTEFDGLIERCVNWMENNAMVTFEMSAQFEDTPVIYNHKYQNLTNVMPNSYAQYLLGKQDRTGQDIAKARELIRFVEDQFVHWGLLKNEDGIEEYLTPGVYEQYYCAFCIDGSAANTINSFIALYQATGNRLCLEKARALANAIVRAQNSVTGEIPTFWVYWYGRPGCDFWYNCSYSAVVSLLRFNELVNSLPEELREFPASKNVNE